jgi:hypothetical protein
MINYDEHIKHSFSSDTAFTTVFVNVAGSTVNFCADAFAFVRK